ncbi:MAG: non-ribosomal peptide synthetase [Rhizonema sp. NSF051]|nr:non-ribosomal peptide synthetase [Rhizonema sp. NSF051]
MDTYKKTIQEEIVKTTKPQMQVVRYDSQTEYPQEACIHLLFEAQVKRTPDAVAVVFEDQQITYRELNALANSLGHYLQALSVKPDVLVGLCVERSIEMVVGMLGILKAGGAYVPLDPAYPPERLQYMLCDSQVPVLLTHSSLVSRLPESGAQVICLDTDARVISHESQENPVSDVNADNLIYVIYTSGSTGQPKGVMIPHRGIDNQLHWRQRTFPLTIEDQVLQTIFFSFDPSVWQIFWPLCFGAQLILAKPRGQQDTAYLVKTISEAQITVIALVPSMLRMLLEEKGIENCQCLKHITCGGEALPVELVKRFFERLNLENVLFNCYGPTEASIDATFSACEHGSDSTVVPIGRPIANTQIYILDEDLQPLPVGESGELHIGGAGLARGYLHRPELTREKFIPNPMSRDSSARLYKTGDLGRYTSDGNIEFLGRVDHQVKIRGFRIELGEIEARLAQHPALQQNLVMAREDVPGDKRLVAYVVALEQVSPMALRSFLCNKLPEYMVPATFVFLDAMPLSPNGKINRFALPVPNSVRQEAENTFVAPRYELERRMTQIWEEVLDIQPIGVRDNFFDLGGHSLLAIRLFTEVEKKLV